MCVCVSADIIRGKYFLFGLPCGRTCLPLAWKTHTKNLGYSEEFLSFGADKKCWGFLCNDFVVCVNGNKWHSRWGKSSAIKSADLLFNLSHFFYLVLHCSIFGACLLKSRVSEWAHHLLSAFPAALRETHSSHFSISRARSLCKSHWRWNRASAINCLHHQA